MMKKCIPPYNFVAVDEAEIPKKRKEAVTHDLFPQKGRYSGRIRCKAYGITPLIVGNEQIDFQDLKPDDPIRQGILSKARSMNQEPNKEHKILKAFTFPDGAFGIPDSALKGMVASTYAAITNSPIERVNDRTFSFRPNIGFGADDAKHVAIPTSGILLKGKNGEWKALLYPITRQDFRIDKEDKDPELVQWLARISEEKLQDWIEDCPQKGSNFLIGTGAGLDGRGLFAKAAKKCTYEQLKKSVVIEFAALKDFAGNPDCIVTIPDRVVRLFNLTKEHLEKDHQASHPSAKDIDQNEINKAIENHFELMPGRFVFLEMLNGEIINMGMNFRYRWRFLDSVTTENMGLGEQEEKTRPMFDLTEESNRTFAEGVNLSPRRRLFGFVDAMPRNHKKKEAVNAMAGRVKFSFAQHVPGTGKIDDGGGRGITLKILGGPKPSSYEFYVHQNGEGKQLCDWGDAANMAGRSRPRGRKFYLHNQRSLWEKNTYEIQQDMTDSFYGNQNQTVDRLLVPDPGKEAEKIFPEFRFTVLFENLDGEELRDLHFSLALGNAKITMKNLEETCKAVQGKGLKDLERALLFEKETQAHKIGHGQPLGLGSLLVLFDRFEILTVENQMPVWKEEIPKLPDLDQNDAFCSLMRITKMRVPSEVIPINYPKVNGEIHAFHSGVRKQQAEARRGKGRVPVSSTLAHAFNVFDRPVEIPEEKKSKK